MGGLLRLSRRTDLLPEGHTLQGSTASLCAGTEISASKQARLRYYRRPHFEIAPTASVRCRGTLTGGI